MLRKCYLLTLGLLIFTLYVQDTLARSVYQSTSHSIEQSMDQSKQTKVRTKELTCLVYDNELTEEGLLNVDNAQRYNNAVKDAMSIEEDELLPLVSLEQGSPMASFDEQGRVLLLTMHSYPDSYVTGSEFNLRYQCWTFTDKEFISWYKSHKSNVSNWKLRIHQLLGMPESRGHNYISAMWVDPKDVIRPAYRTDVYNTQSASSFTQANEKTTGIQTDKSSKKAIDTNEVTYPYAGMNMKMYEQWFDGNIISSYFKQTPFPWTRLGYSYDWYYAINQDGNNGPNEYGMSEFIIPVNSAVKVEYTLTIDEFISKIAKKVSEESEP